MRADPSRFAAAVALAMAAASAAEAGDAAAGKEKAQMCAVCHGLDGVSKNPDSPHLSGQLESYLVRSLKAYKTGERQNQQMSVVASGLSDEDIADLAAYYASIKVTVTPPQ
jgi:cytochrome c553